MIFTYPYITVTRPFHCPYEVSMVVMWPMPSRMPKAVFDGMLRYIHDLH